VVRHVSSYRIQLTPGFGFADAAELAPYLADLGVSHVYLSPVLQAAPGSMHGYDVTDHSRISADLGGEDAFRAMAAKFQARGLRIVLDIVPNHMAICAPESLNRQLWHVLRDGPESPYARWFDIDWEAGGGRMLLPVLGASVTECLDELSVTEDGPARGDEGREPRHAPEKGERVVRYYDHVFPLRPGTAGLPLAELLDAQHYRLAFWRTGIRELNWRRFFDVSTLIGVRVEDPHVFGATHKLILDLVREGLVDGLRVDHPDGLADPRGYLRRLAAAAPGTWIVVEKILEADERLPADWPCAGTTGYDALRVIDGLFVDPAGATPLTSQYARFAGTGVPADFGEVALEAKRAVAADVLTAEVSRLARLLLASDPSISKDDAQAVLTEVLAAFPVYRAYVHARETPAEDAVKAVRAAVADATSRLPERLHPLADAIGDRVLRGDPEFMVRFAQTTGPVLAKGVEDTASYRWPRLVARNEVGGDPDRFAVAPADFHAFAARLAADWPATMTTLSTHDTKRQEDVRARLAVLAEMPGEWGRRVTEWHARSRSLLPDVAGIDPGTAYLVWQTLVGTWLIGEGPIDAGRLSGYLTKAMREAKTRTSWVDVDAGYEDAVQRLGALALEDPQLRAALGEFASEIAADALANSLGAKLVQLTMPGVPDIYQGCELAGLSLVDPDNRRPVDYDRRRDLLRALDADGAQENTSPLGNTGPLGNTVDTSDLDAMKLLVTSRALRLRRDHPDWFADGGYTPLAATGSAAEHVVAFARGDGNAVTVATRLPRGLRGRGGWADTALELPARPQGGAWRDVLTSQSFSIHVKLTELLQQLPVALLVQENG
jgi:(1->4)-alpha-D-glucan 1-alpha-D-glucosylmutase